MTRIHCKFADVVLVPDNGIDDIILADKVETIDGVKCKTEFMKTWNNSDGRYDEDLDFACNMHWNVSFDRLKSMWYARLGKVGDVWNLIKLTKI